MLKGFQRLKLACYTSNISMSIVGNLSPILFLTFRRLYGISYSLLGLLVLINFITQLGIDLVFSFFSRKFHIPTVLRTMPLLTILGLGVYAAAPLLFPDSVYVGLVVGTVIFSAAAGLGEVLVSPVIASIPSKDPDREMSKLHSIYAWGVVAMVIFCTLFLLLLGHDNWQWLAVIFMVVPISSFFLFMGSDIPKMETGQQKSEKQNLFGTPALWLCVLAIFLGGAAECTMAQWASGYLEQALEIPKVWGDVFGVALFAVALGLGRSLYAKFGKNVSKVLFVGSVGATLCYLVCALCPLPVVGIIACGLTGFCVSMMWPGCLVIAEGRFPTGGVVLFAMMAAGGDLGASVGPQLVGIVTDAAMELPFTLSLAETLAISPEQLGMKLGMLVGMLFPLCGILIYGIIRKNRKAKGFEN